MGIIIALLVLLVILIFSALPLHLAVKVLGGDTTIFKTSMVMVLSGIATSAIEWFFGIFSGIIAFILVLFIYMLTFGLSLLRAFFVWILQVVFVGVLLVGAVFLLGSVIGLALPI